MFLPAPSTSRLASSLGTHNLAPPFLRLLLIGSLGLSLLPLSPSPASAQTEVLPDAPAPKAIPVLVPPENPAQPDENVLKLQIFLDQKLFGPGKLDGRPGEFTTKALNRYQRAQGLPETALETHTLDLSSILQAFTTYTIKEEDLKFIGEYPRRPSLQAKKKYLPYESLFEFVSERFHSSSEMIEFINRPMKMSELKAGVTLTVPNVEPFCIEAVTPVPSMPEVPEFQARTLHIDTREKILELREGEKLLASVPITPGSGYLATPPGTWRIVGITAMPTFRWDESVLEYGVRSQHFYQIPMGPNNPVGVMWIGLNKPGIGVHGTNQPETIGRASSHGCMRVANWDVVRLAAAVTKGMTVIIEGPAPVPRPAPVYAKKEPSPPPAAPATERKGFFRWIFGR